MKPLAETLQANEGWLMQRVLAYAKELGFTRYTSSLEEAWRLSIAGLTASLCDAIDGFDRPPELGPDDDVEHDPLARFGVREAEQHRRRGLSLSMFLGLLKYYRQSYLDLLRERTAPPKATTTDASSTAASTVSRSPCHRNGPAAIRASATRSWNPPTARSPTRRTPIWPCSRASPMRC